ncbi:MAG: hypothetical protein R3246_16730 [Acidimicrobiia bacterium]|nr:hypothetical protein [Acidimicrobiia bacterium]
MKGHPVLGAISGFFFGIFLALLLQQFGIWPLDNLTVIGLPIFGIALGLGMAAWAPLGKRRPRPPAGGEPEPAESS